MGINQVLGNKLNTETNEKDQDDIDPKVKRKGILLQICAILCSALSMVMIKDILNIHRTDINLIIWIAVFRLFICFISFCNHLFPGFINLSSKSLSDLTFTCPLIP